MELANRFSIYKRGEPLVSHCTSGNTARGLASRPKNRPARPIEGPLRSPPRHLSHLNFWVFRPFLKIFKNFFAPRARHRPPCAESPHRVLAPPKNRGIPRQNRPSLPRHRLKITRKTPPRGPEKPAPHTFLRKKVESFSLNSIDSPSEKVHT